MKLLETTEVREPMYKCDRYGLLPKCFRILQTVFLS